MDKTLNIENIDWSAVSDQELDGLERQIAARFMHIVPWGVVVWAFTNLLVWLSLWPLTLMGIIPLWLAFPIATLNVMLSYLPSHEAQHSIIGREGSSLRWLNELVGHLSTIPMVSPYRVLKATHFEHHKHCNDPGLDPDYSVHASSNWDFWKKTLMALQPAGEESAYADTLVRIGKAHLMIDALVFRLVYLSVLIACAWSGYAIEAALIWWIPNLIGHAYIRYYLSFAPHYPGEKTGRYKDTRAFKSYMGNILSAGMQYHIVHHLYPRIPLSLTPAAYRALKPILQRKDCELGAL